MKTTLIGRNSYELRRAKRELVNTFVSKYGSMAIENFDCETTEPAAIHDALTNLPFLMEKKLVVLNLPGKNKQLSEKLPDWLEDSESIDVLIVEPAPDKRTSFYKHLQKTTKIKEFNLLAPRDLAAWIRKYGAEKGIQLMPDAVKLLIGRIGAPREGLDPAQYASEIDKLALYEKPKIEAEDVSELVEELPQNTVFNMLDALVAGDAPHTMELYAKLVSQRLKPQEIMSMIVWQVHILMLIRAAGGSEASVATKTKLHPFVVQKNFELASRLDMARLRHFTASLLDAELRIKRDGQEADGVVSTLLVALLHGTAR